MTARSAARRASAASQIGMMGAKQAKRFKRIVADQVLGMEILQQALENKL